MSILNFMYKGEVNVNQSDLQHFLLAAEELHIKGLSTPPTVCQHSGNPTPIHLHPRTSTVPTVPIIRNSFVTNFVTSGCTFLL